MNYINSPGPVSHVVGLVIKTKSFWSAKVISTVITNYSAVTCGKPTEFCNYYSSFIHIYFFKILIICNDPSAGSPTDALLRLLFPLDHTVRLSFHIYEIVC